MFHIIAEFLNVHKRPLAIAALVALLAISSVLVLGRGSIFVTDQKNAVSQSTQESQSSDVQASLSLASQTVLQNGEFNISVEGFAPGEQVLFQVNDGPADAFREVARAKADSDGKVQEMTIKLPDWVTSGARNLEAQGQNSGRRVESEFYVRADKPWANLESYSAKQDSNLALVAGGFEPSENVSVFFEQSPQNILASAVADPAGNTPWIQFSLRGLGSGQYNIIIIGDQSQIKLSEPIVISPRSPWVRLHVYTIGPGGSIGFDGHDFGPNEQIKAFLDEPVGKPIAEVTADEAGNFTVDNAYQAKPNDVGQHRIIIVGDLTTENTISSFDVVPFTPAFQMTTYSGPPGTETSFNGYGFAPGETVRVYMEGREQPVATIQVDSDGSFQNAGQFMVPRNVNGGNLGITLIGESSGARLTQAFSVVRVQPFLGLSAYAGQPGTMVRFRGLGFSAGEQVAIHLGNREGPTIGTVTADAEGRFENAAPFAIPADATQDVAFVAVGEDSGVEGAVRFQVILPIDERNEH